MARLSKQGHEIDRAELLMKTFSLRSNGAILVNKGDGWKVAKLKEGKTWETVKACAANVTPEFAEYRKLVLDEVPLTRRHEFVAAVQILADDVDGLWSTLDDAGWGIDIDTLAEICEARKRWKALGNGTPVEA
jgi:hypothetical protein